MKICPKCGGRFGDEVQVCPVDGTALVAQKSSGGYRVGGRFLLGNLVERRSVGDIYEATEDGTGRKVWTFFAGPHTVPSSAHRDKVLRELQVISGISVPGIVPVLAQGTVEDGRIYVVTEALSDASLAAHVGNKGPLTVSEAAAMARDVARVLKEFQGRGVAHRDLSPSNVFLSPGGAKLLSLGVTTVLDNKIFGDPWFMSPEQAQARPVDARANFYSLGALFYYGICGMPPYTDTDPATLVERHKSGGFQPPTKARPDLKLPAEVDRIVARAMAVNPLARYFSFDEMITEFGRLVGDAGQAAQASAPAQQAASVQPAAPAQQAASVQPAAPAPAQPAGGQQAAPSTAAGRRRRRKGGFRATMWFMKGEQIQQAAAAETDEKELLEVTAGDGQISDAEKDLMDRYRDDGSIKAEDRAKFSLRTGQTGMMQAVQVPESPSVGRSVDEKGVVESLDRSRKTWIWLGVVAVLVGIGVFAYYMWRNSIPASFVYKAMGKDLRGQVPSFEPPPPRIDLPALPAVPTGSLKALWEGLLKAKAGPLLPEGAAGPGEYLVAFEGKLTELSKVKATKRHRRRSRRPADPLVRDFKRKAGEVRKQLAEIRKDVVAKLSAKVTWTRGKVYEGQDTDKWIAAYRAGKILSQLDNVPNKEKIESLLRRMTKAFFKESEKKEPAAREAAAESPLAGLSIGMDVDKAVGTLKCLKVERVLSGTKQTVTCKGKDWTVVLTAFPKDKKITGAKYVVGGKEMGHLGGDVEKKDDKSKKDARGAARPRARAR